jgi:hypothetical protein
MYHLQPELLGGNNQTDRLRTECAIQHVDLKIAHDDDPQRHSGSHVITIASNKDRTVPGSCLRTRT